MQDADARPRFSFFTNLYALLFVAAALLTPILWAAILSRHAVVGESAWLIACSSSVLVGVAFLYANARCSSSRLTFREGMLFVAASMSTGWMYMSLFFSLAGLAIAFAAAVGLSLYNDITRSPAQSPIVFHRVVAAFYRHRMRQ
jgi:hypothetical protein